MIKGCSKRVIVMKETGSDMIEEAFFILKPTGQGQNIKHDDIIKQANAILERSSFDERFSSLSMNVALPQRKRKNPAQFVFGTLFGGVLTALVMMLA